MQAKALNQPFLLLLAFLSGGAVMVAEMAGARSLSPHFGSSTYIWANVIGCLMAAMALGYYTGGRLADRSPKLSFLLALVGGAGAFAALVPLVLNPLCAACVPEGIGAEHSFRINVLGSLLVSVLLLAPLVFLLGMIPPFLVRLMTEDVREAGRSAGRVNAFGAVGSILGTFLPTLVLVPALGTRLTFTLAGGILLATAAGGTFRWGSAKLRKWAWLWLVPVLPSVLVGSNPVHGGAETLVERESPYQYIRVYEREGRRFLTLNEGRDQYHSLLIEGKFLTAGNYYDYLNLVPLHFDPRLRRRLRVCVVGLAAGIYTRQIQHFFGDWYDVEADGAEIDPEVLDVSREFFGLGGREQRNLFAAAADGRVFLETSEGEYDLIAVDAYSRQLYIPFHLITEEFFRLCCDRLAPGGFVAVNVCDFGSHSPALGAIRDTVVGVFGNAYTLRLPGTLNYIVYARKGRPDAGLSEAASRLDDPGIASVDEGEDLKSLLLRSMYYRSEHHAAEGPLVLTDDRAPIERLMDASFRRVRANLRLKGPQ